MLKRYFLVGFWMLAAVAVIPFAVSCGSDKDASAQYGDDVSGLVNYYQEMREAGLAGKVEKFQSMRDSVTKAEVDAYFTRMGWVIDSAKVSTWSFNWPDINDDAPLAQDSILENWRRLVFKKCGVFNRTGVEQCVHSIIMFHKDGDNWKVSNATRIGGPRYDGEGNEIPLYRLSYHLMFRLPPSYEDLRPQPYSPDTLSQPEGPIDSILVPRRTKGQ